MFSKITLATLLTQGVLTLGAPTEAPELSVSATSQAFSNCKGNLKIVWSDPATAETVTPRCLDREGNLSRNGDCGYYAAGTEKYNERGFLVINQSIGAQNGQHCLVDNEGFLSCVAIASRAKESTFSTSEDGIYLSYEGLETWTIDQQESQGFDKMKISKEGEYKIACEDREPSSREAGTNVNSALPSAPTPDASAP
ncbi:MAG: hypothetical protein M1829_000062 [Trizodia sp. TS-e1964]|nr:MAG: hypothetical protein M1829_000062 [Trizodia sp. TS-e1964]